MNAYEYFEKRKAKWQTPQEIERFLKNLGRVAW
jgi:hypothetical protein